jgi:hypothetical protein
VFSSAIHCESSSSFFLCGSSSQRSSALIFFLFAADLWRDELQVESAQVPLLQDFLSS